MTRPSPDHYDAAERDVDDEIKERGVTLLPAERKALIDERAHLLAVADRDERPR